MERASGIESHPFIRVFIRGWFAPIKTFRQFPNALVNLHDLRLSYGEIRVYENDIIFNCTGSHWRIIIHKKGAMISAEDAVHIYQRLSANGIQIWLCGGWGIDALLGEQTRPHKDLDVMMRVDDMERMIEILGRDGYTSQHLWEENKWVTDERGRKIATALFVEDLEGRQFDAHAIRFDDDGNGIPAWENPQNFILTRKDLSNAGMIAGVAVECISPDMQVRFHMGYELPEDQSGDLAQLYQRFGVI